MRNWQNIKKKGFTLIELLIAISIIGILVTLLVSNFLGIRMRSSDVQKKANLDQLKKALRLYYNDHQSYPESYNYMIQDPTQEESAQVMPGSEFQSDTGEIYMSEVPEYNAYVVSSDGEIFMAIVAIDNESDEDAVDSIDRCNYEERMNEDSSLQFETDPSTLSPGQYYMVCSE